MKEPWEMTKEEWEELLRKRLTEEEAVKYFPRKNIYDKYRIYHKRYGVGEESFIVPTYKFLKAPKSGTFEINQYILQSNPDFIETLRRWHIEQALKEGKPVPPEVLKDYPDLAEKYGEAVREAHERREEKKEEKKETKPKEEAVVEKLAELIEEKEKIERETRGRAEKTKELKTLKEDLLPISRFVERIEARLEDKELYVLVVPKDSPCIETKIPLEYRARLTPDELRKLDTTEKEYAKIILDRFYREYLAAPAILTFEGLTSKLGSALRGREVFMALCQRGSPYHCSVLRAFLVGLIDKILGEWDVGIRRYMVEDVRAAGLKTLAHILSELPAELSDDERTIIGEAINEGIKEILGGYAALYMRPEYMIEGDVQKSWEVIEKACKEPLYALVPEDVDETPILEALRRVSRRVPSLTPLVAAGYEEEVEEIKRRLSALEEERRKLLEKVRKYERGAK